ncbi:MAG: hypothetical protein ABIH01_02135 [Candidatus Omnitrophota bacterium]
MTHTKKVWFRIVAIAIAITFSIAQTNIVLAEPAISIQKPVNYQAQGLEYGTQSPVSLAQGSVQRNSNFETNWNDTESIKANKYDFRFITTLLLGIGLCALYLAWGAEVIKNRKKGQEQAAVEAGDRWYKAIVTEVEKRTTEAQDDDGEEPSNIKVNEIKDGKGFITDPAQTRDGDADYEIGLIVGKELKYCSEGRVRVLIDPASRGFLDEENIVFYAKGDAPIISVGFLDSSGKYIPYRKFGFGYSLNLYRVRGISDDCYKKVVVPLPGNKEDIASIEIRIGHVFDTDNDLIKKDASVYIDGIVEMPVL